MTAHEIVEALRRGEGVPTVMVGTPEHDAVVGVMAAELAECRKQFKQVYSRYLKE